MEKEISIESVLDENLISFNLKGKEKDDILKEMVDILYKNKCISNSKVFLQDVYSRENEGFTGIGEGIAIPHGKSDTVLRTSVVVGRTEKDIDWNSIDGKPVHLIIMLAIKSFDKTVHIKLLSKIATSLCKKENIEELMKVEDKRKVIELFSRD